MKSVYPFNVKSVSNLVLIIAISLLSVFFTGCKEKQVQQKILPGVQVIKAQNKNIFKYFTSIGQAESSNHVHLYARVEGYLEEKNFFDGAYVKKGEVLFQIQREQYQAQVNAAEAALLKAESDLKYATIEYNRFKKLAKTSAVSQEKFDNVSSTYTQVQASILSRKAELALQKLLLNYTLVKAPFSGRVGIAPYFVGELVGPSSKPLIYLAKLDPIWVEFVIPEGNFLSYMQEILEKDKIVDHKNRLLVTENITPYLILSNGTEYTHTGTINFLDNKIDSSTGTYLMRASFPNPNNLLLPGAYVSVKVHTKQTAVAILIPQSTLQEDQLGKFVLVVNKENRVESRHIVVGEIFGDDILVRKGLNVGDLIIFHGIQKVRTGMKVKPVLAKIMPFITK